MMNESYPVPPPELVQQWRDDWVDQSDRSGFWVGEYIATQAARWGADRELDAVCDEILHCVAGIYEDTVSDWSELVNLLRDSRRPKPPSLKEQALKELQVIRKTFEHQGLNNKTPALDAALERLGELEQLDD